jgi:hypothetical protein
VTNDEIAAKWAEALPRSFSELQVFSAPTMQVWHNTDGAWITAEESNRQAALLEQKGMPVFDEIRTLITAKGFVVQTSIAHPRDDTKCTYLVQVATVEGGLVTRLEEYIVPGHRTTSPAAP